MASSKNNLTAVHYSLVFFVMLTVGLGAWAYVSARALHLTKEAEARAKKTYDEEDKIEHELDDQILQLKALAGYDVKLIRDDADPANANTMLRMMDTDMVQFGGTDPPQMTFNAVIAALRLKLDTVSQSRQALQGDSAILDEQAKSLNTRYDKIVDQFTQAKDAAERQKQDLEDKHRANVQKKNQEIQTLKTNLTDVQNQHNTVVEERRLKAQEQAKETKALLDFNKITQEDIDKTAKVSFEKADGVIRWVDNVKKRVLISVGESDLLPKRTNFSVWKKSHLGIGRDVADIKAGIEVTRLIDSHLAEARILYDRTSDPVMPGDPIYTPLWSPGRTEKFALVGVLDIDDDERSDRQLLHDVIEVTGSVVAVEIDDEAKLIGADVGGDPMEPEDYINIGIKFLVVGHIPDPVVGVVASEKLIVEKIGKAYKDMRNKARDVGVRRVPLEEFMAFIGYKPQRRLWRPGEQTKFTLKAGAHSTGVDDTVADPESSGTVSRIFSAGRRKLKQDASSGQTSKSFGGKGRN